MVLETLGKFCIEAYFLGLRFLNEPEKLRFGVASLDIDFYNVKKSASLSNVWIHKPWDSRGLYPEAIEVYFKM